MSSATRPFAPPENSIQVISVKEIEIALTRLKAEITVEDILSIVREDKDEMYLNKLLARDLSVPNLPKTPQRVPGTSTTPPPSDTDSFEYHEFRRRRMRKFVQDLGKPWENPVEPRQWPPAPAVSVVRVHTGPPRSSDPLYQERRRQALEYLAQFPEGLPPPINDYSWN